METAGPGDRELGRGQRAGGGLRKTEPRKPMQRTMVLLSNNSVLHKAMLQMTMMLNNVSLPQETQTLLSGPTVKERQ